MKPAPGGGLYFNVVLPPGIPGDPLFVFRIHLLGMRATFRPAAILITALLLRMATQLRQREQQIAAMRHSCAMNGYSPLVR